MKIRDKKPRPPAVDPGTLKTDTSAMALEIDADLRALPFNAKAPMIRSVRRKYTKRLTKASAREVVEIAERLQFDFWRRFVASELLYYHPAARASLKAKQVEAFGRGIASWGEVDLFAGYIAGPAWLHGQISDKLIHKWARSKDRWWRRTALVCTVVLNSKAWGGTGDAPRTLKVCRMLVDDQDDMVVKAMSWALRKLIQHDRKAVQRFLTEHDGVLAARVKREVRNKLTTGLKNPRRN
jgi:3-methyladenine DNA glycosylase AlkD